MAPNATLNKPARIPAAKQPPQNSVWVRYHPWIEGVMGGTTSLSLHLLVIVGALLIAWLAFYLGFAHTPRSLPVEPVVFRDSGGGGDKQGTGKEKGGERAAPKEGALADEDKQSAKNSPVNSSDQAQLHDVTPPEPTDLKFTAPNARFVMADSGLDKFKQLNDDIQNQLKKGLDASKGERGSGKDGGKGAGDGTGEGTGAGPGKATQAKMGEREKRMLRWSMKFKTHDATDYLRQLQALGAVLAIQNGPNSFEVVDLTKRPFKPEVKDLSTIQKIWWIDDNPQSVQGLVAALGLRMRAGRIIAFIPNEVEEELAEKEKAYGHLDENDIFETTFAIDMPGAGGRKYDLQVMNQKRK